MIITVDDLKSALGVTSNEDNAKLNTSVMQANALIAGYIGFDVSDITKVYSYSYDATRRYEHYTPLRNFIQLPVYPVLDVVSLVDAAGVPVTGYTLEKNTGTINFVGGLPYSDYVVAQYHAGYDPVPSDLVPVALNLAAMVYNNGGMVVGVGSQLKTLTMFDAMSMSFDNGDLATGGPEAMIKPWAFILNKYQITNVPVVK